MHARAIRTFAVAAVVVLMSGCSGSDDEFTVSTIETSAAETSAAEPAGDTEPSADEEPATTTTSEPATTTEAPPTARVNSADQAGELAVTYLNALAIYIEAGVVGDGARVADLEAGTELWAPGANVDTAGAHSCYVEGFLSTRAFLDDDAVYEFTADVTNVLEVRGGLWVVEYNVSQFITGIGEIVDDGAGYVSSDGFIGGRPDPDDSDPTCLEQHRALDAETEALFAEAAAADQ